jgi:hypothetical protein
MELYVQVETWTKWLGLDGEEDTVRHLEITLCQEDRFRLPIYCRNTANTIMLTTVREYLRGLQSLKIFVGWDDSVQRLRRDVRRLNTTEEKEYLPVVVDAWISPPYLQPRPATKIWYQGMGPRPEAGLIYEWKGRPIHNRDASNR